MARVVLRVELHNATSEQQYERLHAQMINAGFSRTIVGADGRRFWLPPATYSSERYANHNVARDAAWSAASGIVPSYAVVGTCGDSAWQGLRAVD